MKKCLHLVSFDIPYPPNYGGVIDVFYKIKALKALDIDIILHCFKFNRKEQRELDSLCSEVYYYKRNNYITSLLSPDFPFIVKSRGNDELIKNLIQDNHPILFDGLHTTYVMSLHDFSAKKAYVRAHNIEHLFYRGLSESETSLFKRSFFKKEAQKLQKYEKILRKVNGVFSISPYEQKYFYNTYGDHCHYIPVFHNHEVQNSLQKSEKFVLYHGNIAVSENSRAALFLVNIYKDSNIRLVIASSFQNSSLHKEIEKHKNIDFEFISAHNSLNDLFERAQIHALPTFQKTGIKLKLLNTLYQGRHVLANNPMIEDTGLESLCHLANTKKEFLQLTHQLMETKFTAEERHRRMEVLKAFDPLKSAQKMIDIIFQ